MKQLSVLFIFIFFCGGLRAQSPLNILAGPVHLMNCPDLCVTMHATYPKPLKTDVYSVGGIPFSPLPPGGTLLNLNDDKFTTALPLGFDFCFFNNVYSQCYLADNGVLTFNSAYSGQSCNNNIQQTLPYFNSTFPDNAIFFLFMDVNPVLGGTVRYQTVGTAPFRKFVVSYENVRLFGNSCTNTTSSFQVILCETTHNIETHITGKAVCDNNALNYANYATVGLQNLGATVFYTAAGKHASVFTATSEAIRFGPSGAPAYTMNWKIKADTILGTNTDSISFCPSVYPYNYLKAELTLDCPPGFYTDSVSLTKNIPDILNVQMVPPFCASDPTGSLLINASVNTPPAMYSINGGAFQLSNVFNNLLMGTYTLTVKDANGCQADTAVLLMAANFMYISDSIFSPICPVSNGSIVVSMFGGSPPYTFAWSNGDLGNMADSLGPGTVTVTVTDSAGCVQQFPYTLYWDSIPLITPAVTKPVCGNAAGAITLSINNGTPPYTMLWNTGDTSYTVNNLTPNNIYSVIVTDVIGCTGVYVVYLEDTLNTSTTTSFSNTSCGLVNGTATILPDSGLPPYTFIWTPGGQTTATAIGLPPGTYYCTTSDANNCTEIDSVMIGPSVGTVNTVAWSHANCDTSNGAIYLTGVQNAPNGYTQLWSNGQTGTYINGLAAGTYWVTTFTPAGCQKTDTVVLANEGKPQLYVVSYDPPHCYGEKGSALLGGTLGTLPYKYSLDGITYQSNAQLNYLLAGVYTIYITDANSCINSTTITFTEPPLITLNYTADTVVCAEDNTATVHFSAGGGTPGYEYRFNYGLYSADTMYDALQQGIYPLEVRDANNCVRPFNIKVTGPSDTLEVIISKKDLYCLERNTGSFTASITGGWPPYAYTWSNGSTGLTFSNLGETKMTLYVTDSMGCKTEKYVNIDILGCCQMVIPNAFTPNGDGLNDHFKPIGVSTVSSVKFSIYDRWGHVVFRSNSIGDKWNGTENDTPCSTGVYFYYVEYTCPQEFKKFVLKGDVTLVR